MIAPLLHRRCRACGGTLTEVLHLGDLRLNAFPATMADIELSPKVPHQLMVCRGCSLCQLAHTTPPDLMFRQYWYKSSVNEAMRHELKTIVVEAAAEAKLQKDDWVLDIGANDGTLLRAYSTPGLPPVRRVAVEPATNLQSHLDSDTCDIAIHDYFPTHKLEGHKRRFKIITAIAMAYDLEDPTTFFRKITQLLAPDGIVVVQFQDLEQQMRAAAFDNIVAEHLEYYTLSALAQIVNGAGLYPYDCRTTPINGGSLRVTLRRGYVRNTDWRNAVQGQIDRERAAKLTVSEVRTSLEAFERFAHRVASVQRQITSTLQQVRDSGLPVDAYGASTKGNTLLQVLGLGPDQIRRVADRSPEKHGRFTLTGIPIVGEDEWRANAAPVTLVPIWQFREGVLVREKKYLEAGGQFVFPLPQVEIVAERWGSDR